MHIHVYIYFILSTSHDNVVRHLYLDMVCIYMYTYILFYLPRMIM